MADAQYLSSDSDDEDYVPPAPRGGAGSSKAGPPPEESDMDSATADAYYAMDAVPEYADSDVERPRVTFRGRGSAGAGPSSAGPSSAGAGASGGRVAGAGAGGSSKLAASKEAGESAAGGKDTRDNRDGADEGGTGKEAKEKADAKSVENKKSVDDLWAEMNKPISKPAPSATKAAPAASAAAGLGDWLAGPTSLPPKASAARKLPRLDDLEKTRKAEDEADEIKPAKKQKVGTGLEAVLSKAKGEAGPNTLEKTKEAWKDFKKDDQEVTDELETYKKDKNRYTDKVAFLDRSNKREWEVEQAGKKQR